MAENIKYAVDTVDVPLSDKSIKKYRELSESLWEIQGFDPEGPYREAECIPIIAPTHEITEGGIYETVITDAADSLFQELLENLETSLAINAIHCNILRCLLVRVKKGCQIYPHVDLTFNGIHTEAYRMQIVRSSDKPFVKMLEKTSGEEVGLAPEIGLLRRVPNGVLQAEENIGLDDNIHLLLYTQPKSGQESLKELVSGWR